MFYRVEGGHSTKRLFRYLTKKSESIRLFDFQAFRLTIRHRNAVGIQAADVDALLCCQLNPLTSSAANVQPPSIQLS